IQKIDRIKRYFVNWIDASSDPDGLGNRLEQAGSLHSRRIIPMSYAIIGFGSIGQALARAFARNDIEVTVASRRPPEALLPQALGPKVIPGTLQEAVKADVIILAVLFEAHQDVGKALPDWKGKTIIDAMNTNAPVETLDGLPSSAFAARSFPGARFVKGFNHLLARTLTTDPNVQGGHRVVFLSGDDEAGTLVQARGRVWGPLIFQDLFKQQP